MLGGEERHSGSGSSTHPGTCSWCKRRREVTAISRQGGGSYNRAPRQYRSSICDGCAVSLLPRAGVHAGAKSNGYSVRTLVDIAQRAAPELAAEWVVRKAEYDAQNAERREASRAAMRQAAGQ
jgi:hypothetical protein